MNKDDEIEDHTGQTITCYPVMNNKIVELLRVRGDAISLYAAQRIEDLEKQNENK